MKKKYIIPTIKVVDIDFNDGFLISQSDAQEYMKNDKWYWEDGHIYNPGGQDKCPEGSHTNVMDNIW